MSSTKAYLNELYTGKSRRSVWFRYAMFAFDIVSITYFIAVTPVKTNESILAVNSVVALIILLDFMARLWIAPNKREHLLRIYVLADAIVLLSIILNQFAGVDYGAAGYVCRRQQGTDPQGAAPRRCALQQCVRPAIFPLPRPSQPYRH